MIRRSLHLWPAGLTLVFGLAMSALLGVEVKHRVEAEAKDRFAFVCDQITLTINQRLESFELILRGGAAVFAASESVERSEWRTYVETLKAVSELPGLQGVGYALAVPVEKIDAHRAAVRAEGYADYDVRPPRPAAPRRPEAGEAAADVVAPIYYLEPADAANRAALGFDLFSLPTVRSAMEKARDTDDSALSGAVGLPLGRAGPPDNVGTVLFVPVFRDNVVRGTFEQRREELLGWAFSPLHLGNLVGGVLAPWTREENTSINLRIRNGLEENSETPLFASRADRPPGAASLFYQRRIIDFNGQAWLLEFDRADGASTIDYAPAWLAFDGGIALSLLLFALTLSTLNTRTRAQQIAGRLTSELRDSEARLRESERKLAGILDNVDSYIYLKDREGRYLFANRRVLDLFGASESEVIGRGDEAFFDAPTVAHIRENDAQVLRAGQSVRIEETNLNLRDGQAATYYSVKVPLRDEFGDIYALCGISTDITEFRRTANALLQEQQFSKALLDRLPGIFFLCSYPDFRLVLWNQQNEALLGLSADEMKGRRIAECVYPGAEALVHESLETIMRTGHGTVEAPLLAKDGHAVHFALTGARFETADAVFLMGIGVDISQRKQAEEKLLLAASVFAHAREGIMITDLDGNILDVNDAFTRITGYARDEVLGRNPRFLGSGRQNTAFYSALWRDLTENGHWYGEIWNRRRNGDIFAVMQNISAVVDAHGQPCRYVSLFSDITALKENERKLEHIAHYDVLTTLPNRVLLADRMHQAMAQASRRGTLLAVAYLDLDGFKEINDRYGHESGDQLLLAIASHMKEALRESDTLARLGGDEFVAVILDLDNSVDSLPMLNRLLAAAAQPVLVGDRQLQVSASLGATFFPQADEVDADQLLRQADQAMYQAKLAGKNRYHLFDADQDRTVRSLHETQQYLRRALAAGEFVLHYQPKVNMRSGRIVGAEALVRWQHPERGLLPPSEFLPMIEDHPLAIELGEWVIGVALNARDYWQTAGLDIPVSVNIGARQLQQPDFVERLQAILATHPSFRPGDLEMEVLETSALKDLARISQVIGDCRRIGVDFSLDDFGTGYSSLTYLKRLAVTQLKIDQSFVRDMLDDPDDLAILEGVLGLATAFRRNVIAEGVETVEHGEMLLQLGCETAQGYGIARPMPAADLPEWSRSWHPVATWIDATTVERDDLPLLYARTEQRAWIASIERYLTGDRQAPPHEPAAGSASAWLRGEGYRRYHQQPAYRAIDQQWPLLRALVATLCQQHESGRTAEAMERLPELYAARDELLGLIKTLSQIGRAS